MLHVFPFQSYDYYSNLVKFPATMHYFIVGIMLHLKQLHTLDSGPLLVCNIKDGIFFESKLSLRNRHNKVDCEYSFIIGL